MMEKKAIEKGQRWLERQEPAIRNQTGLSHVLSDPTRIKILLLLIKFKELCVSDLSSMIGISISAISHQLNALDRAGLVTSKKMGKMVCYYPQVQNVAMSTVFKHHFKFA